MDGLLRAGLLEQTCPSCGRWEAAGACCSWCGRDMTEADWYRNGLLEERRARIPDEAPAAPPPEFRQARREDTGAGWPEKWGANPFVRGRQPAADPG